MKGLFDDKRVRENQHDEANLLGRNVDRSIFEAIPL